MIDDILGNGGFIAQMSTEIKYLYRYLKGLDIHIYVNYSYAWCIGEHRTDLAVITAIAVW